MKRTALNELTYTRKPSSPSNSREISNSQTIEPRAMIELYQMPSDMLGCIFQLSGKVILNLRFVSHSYKNMEVFH